MNLMQLIKLVLDDAYKAITAKDDDAKDNLIKKELSTLSSEYANLTNTKTKPIDYSDPLKRFAYIYKYTVAHADYIMQLILGEKELRDLLKKNNVEVACLGGGPGSDLLGLLKYMINAGIKNTKLTCYIFDKERAWGDSWSDVAIQLNPAFQLNPVFQQLDVTDPATWKSYQKFLGADLFTLSYFLSEVWKIRDQAEPFFDHCLSQMKPGSLLLFIDNNSPKFVQWFDALAAKHNLKPVHVHEKKLAFSNSEEKTDLGVYYKKFGWPKRESDAAFRIMRKG
jgi:SAM-dependent methyltransferase